jgi:hypothetical protein
VVRRVALEQVEQVRREEVVRLRADDVAEQRDGQAQRALHAHGHGMLDARRLAEDRAAEVVRNGQVAGRIEDADAQLLALGPDLVPERVQAVEVHQVVEREDVSAHGLARERGLLVGRGGHPEQARRVTEADAASVHRIGVARHLVDPQHAARDHRVREVDLVGERLVALEGERVDVVGEGQRVLPGRLGTGEHELVRGRIACKRLRGEEETESERSKNMSGHRVLAAKVAIAVNGGLGEMLPKVVSVAGPRKSRLKKNSDTR